MCTFFLSSDHLWVLFPDVFMVVTSEVAVDIIKHAFITKFNDITADVRTTPDIHVSFTNKLCCVNFFLFQYFLVSPAGVQ